MATSWLKCARRLLRWMKCRSWGSSTAISILPIWVWNVSVWTLWSRYPYSWGSAMWSRYPNFFPGLPVPVKLQWVSMSGEGMLIRTFSISIVYQYIIPPIFLASFLLSTPIWSGIFLFTREAFRWITGEGFHRYLISWPGRETTSRLQPMQGSVRYRPMPRWKVP